VSNNGFVDELWIDIELAEHDVVNLEPYFSDIGIPRD
jgi:hypothetical protein